MLTVIFGLGSALGYALHDFLMVKIVRGATVFAALTWSMAVGTVVLVPLALIVDGVPSGHAEWRAVAFAVASGVCEGAALACLLRGLITGNLSVVAPLASLAGGIAAVVMIARGESLSTLAYVGLPIAVAGGLMASLEKAREAEGTPAADEASRRTRATAGAGWALLASVLLAANMLLFAEASALRAVEIGACGRIGAMIAIIPIVMLVGGPRMPRPLAIRSSCAGLVGAAAVVALAAAVSIGPVAIASVFVSQVGTMAVLLGLIVLKERLAGVQLVGVVLTCLAAALIASG